MDKQKIRNAVVQLLDGIGHPKDDPNITETPDRVAKMFIDIMNGYKEDPTKHLKLFPSENRDMVIVRNVPFYSYCAHHLQPFYGKLTIGYIPDGKVLGLSKLVRVSRVFAKRLQLQEDLTKQIAEFLWKNLNCKGVAVNIKSQHMCMVVRGVRSYGAETVTTKFEGIFNGDQGKEIREQFLNNTSDKEGY